MILNFGDKITEDIFHGITNKKTRSYNNILSGILRKLDMINSAEAVEDLRSPPANHLEKLKGNLKDFHSIRINDQYRIIFKWLNKGAHDVRIIDYH